jgi:hypothetical protein
MLRFRAVIKAPLMSTLLQLMPRWWVLDSDTQEDWARDEVLAPIIMGCKA